MVLFKFVYNVLMFYYFYAYQKLLMSETLNFFHAHQNENYLEKSKITVTSYSLSIRVLMGVVCSYDRLLHINSSNKNCIRNASAREEREGKTQNNMDRHQLNSREKKYSMERNIKQSTMETQIQNSTPPAYSQR